MVEEAEAVCQETRARTQEVGALVILLYSMIRKDSDYSTFIRYIPPLPISRLDIYRPFAADSAECA